MYRFTQDYYLCLIYLIGSIKFLHILPCLLVTFTFFVDHIDKDCIYLRALNIIFVKLKHHKWSEFDDSGVLDCVLCSVI